ncbi:hypothetical protein ACFV83_01130 [Streptomyces pharetrae]|uniref:hypothetical protein n=1 Tax=Streptomyces pharetrae TaxID=291370 RepID=UPI00345FFFCB
MPTLVLAFLCSFGGVPVAALAVGRFTGRRPGRVLPPVPLATSALLVPWPGRQGHQWMRGPVLGLAREAVPERPATVHGLGARAVGEGAPARSSGRAGTR